MFTRFVLSLGALVFAICGTTAAAGEEPTPPPDLESALHEVLVHNDLTDIDFLAKTLGIGFRVSAPVPAPYWFGKDDDRHVRVMVTSNPQSMFAEGLAYTNELDARRPETQFRLHFIPRDRPNVSKWATDWKLKVSESQATEAAGSAVLIQAGSPGGIAIEAFFSTRGGYDVTLTQSKEGAEPFSSRVAMDLMPPATLARQVGALIAEGDLRQYHLTAKILNAALSVEPESMRNGHWYYGNAVLESVIAGVDPGNFFYNIDEFGWVSPPAFFVVPAHLDNRTVNLNLTVDVYHVCLAPKDLEAEFKRRSINFTLESRDSDGSIYSMAHRNKITLQARLFRRCINELDFSQITDFGLGFATPIVFSVSESLDEESVNLNGAAIQRVNWVAHQAAAVQLGGIDIDQFQGKATSESERAVAIRLAHLLRQAFSDRGIKSNLLKVQTGLHPQKRERDGPYVTVDAYTK